jgi:hypothetical protein
MIAPVREGAPEAYCALGKIVVSPLVFHNARRYHMESVSDAHATAPCTAHLEIESARWPQFRVPPTWEELHL